MNFLKLSFLLGLAQTAAIIPASAAMIVNQTGPLSDFNPYQISETAFSFDIMGIAGPMSASPGFGFRPIFVNGQPAQPWTYVGPRPHYVVKLITSALVSNAQWEQFGADYYNDYMSIDGTWTYIGGDDNSGGIFPSCPSLACTPASQVGNTTTFSFDGYENASWSSYANGEIFEQRWTWFNGVHFYGELPISDKSGNYTLQVFATNVPEPATWAMMLLGFGALGLQLRRQGKSFGINRQLALVDAPCHDRLETFSEDLKRKV